MMATQTTFTAADRERFAFISGRLKEILPDILPRSEAVLECARYFVEVRDRGYQQMDGHESCEGWMDRAHRIGPHQWPSTSRWRS